MVTTETLSGFCRTYNCKWDMHFKGKHVMFLIQMYALLNAVYFYKV